MNTFTSSQALINAVIQTKTMQAFLTNIDSSYRIDEKWLSEAIDRLIFTLNARLLITDEYLDLEDDAIDRYVEAIVNKLCQNIERSIPKSK